MFLIRALPRFLLALALVAGGLAGAGVSAMEPAPESTADSGSPPCHESAPGEDLAEDSATGLDCCDEGTCGCDCLHPPPLAMADGGLGAPVSAALGSAGSLRAPPAALASPDIRPPIG